ncbi:hypothetical protein DKX38_027433 [Salix brachista]|uniref:DUF4220 domain-containing protein n=1 Tax=Salix brachista TaxID=2182728 RepID=A0A5N5JH94_9ROSI|nr:hypothetical protein DKX38_027433 [Salix brachista]
MGIPKVSETVERLWNGWELRMVMLLSLFLQILLILFGRRRKYTAGFWIGKLVWSWWSEDPLLFVAIPIFVAGIIKYGERNWVLRSASSKQCRNEMNELSRKFEEFSNPDVFEMTDEPVVGELGLSDIIDEAKFLHEADLCFQMFRVLFADLVLGDSIHLATHIFL